MDLPSRSPDELCCGRIGEMRAASDTVWIEQRAKSLGFDLCGVVNAAKFPELAQTEEWLARGYAGEMNYLSDARRSDPESAMPGIRSVIACALNYNTEYPKSIDADPEADADEPRSWISRYAWGSDYHDVLRGKLEELVVALRGQFEESFEARVYADTGPLQERAFAKYAGLGWLGKNTLLLNQTLGSWFFLGVVLTTLDLAPTLGTAESPPPDLCGTCRRCIDACPTDALVEPYVMDARRCISYLTIELRGGIPEELREPMGRHVFGCDICQDVCPWNRRAPVTQEQAFQPRVIPVETKGQATGSASLQDDSLFLPKLEWLASLEQEEYRKVFRGSPVKRTKWRGLVRNACMALGNSKLRSGAPAHQRISALLQRLAASPDALISESALWALSRIQ
jgi:epoxyqueuosine reductase